LSPPGVVSGSLAGGDQPRKGERVTSGLRAAATEEVGSVRRAGDRVAPAVVPDPQAGRRDARVGGGAEVPALHLDHGAEAGGERRRRPQKDRHDAAEGAGGIAVAVGGRGRGPTGAAARDGGGQDGA